MANTVIQLKHSTVQGNVPVSLANGEISINTRDGKLFYADPTGTIQEFSGFAGPAGLNGEIQFNDSGVLGANAGLTFNKSTGTLTASGQILGSTFKSTQSSGDEGGQLDLSTAATNNLLLGGSVNIDIYQNKLRIFEAGGTNRGVYIDIANGATAGVGTDLLNPAATPDTVARAQANAAFITANAAFITANNAANTNLTQNTSITAAFVAANSAGVYANGAFAAANNALNTNLTQNNSITAAFAQANAAYTRANNSLNANTGGTVTGTITATSFVTTGTYGDIQGANAIYANTFIANTGGYIQFADGSKQYTANAGSGASSGVSIVLDAFTGTGACTTFTLTSTPTNENYTIITVNGVTQAKTTYSLSGASLVFSEAPPNTAEIEVLTFSTPGTSGLLAYNQEFSGTGACTIFGLTSSPTSENYTIISIDGVIQHKSTYSIAGGDITFSEAPANGTTIDVTYFVASTLLDSQLTIYAANHANAAFIAANNATDTYVRNHANSAFHQANAAYAQANTNASDITVIQGVNVTQNTSITNLQAVNLTQNTNITNAQNTADAAFLAANNATDTYVRNHANSAFHQANAAYAQANTNASNITVIQGVNVTQNTNISNLEAVNLTQNTNITNAQNSASAAFIRANNSLNANVGGVITGPVTISANLTVTGNLTVSGNTIRQDVASLNIADPLIYLGANNYAGDAVEIGFAANYFDGSTQRHTGIFREASNKEYYVFENYDKEPDANLIDINDASFKVATLNANLKSQLITLNNQNLQTYVNGSYNTGNAAFNQANAAFTTANSAGKTIILFSDAPPAGPTNNTLWWQSNTGVLKVWYTDTDGSQWVDASPVAPTSSLLISNDTTSTSTIFPIFTSNTTGALSNVSVSSTKLTYTPSSGTLTAVDFNSTSDLRRKENVQTIENGLQIVQQIDPVSFNWKETGKQGFGVIAQEIEKILPSIVGEDGEGYKSISYNQLISFLISAVKEQQKQIDELKRKIDGN